MTETAADGRAAEKRRRILQSAWRLALRVGLRGATMEGLAREAGIAKGTLYAQFPDKEAVLGAVIDDRLVELEAAFAGGMGDEGSAAERIGAALAAKYSFIMDAVEGSPHANEILNVHHEFAARFAALDRGIEARVAAALADAGAANPASLASLAIGAADGVARRLREPAVVDAAIRLLCRRLIEPETRR
ncbi:MAG: TetR/AcrR family transcriptional regulator [Bradyrhizobium sp.]|nr:MAG: TetR/AcrR family transcriptional regulator [Bradyrhizobium sp.]